jgi:Uncharacterized conserved protein
MDPKQIVHADPEILGGTPVFVGTRVPVDALIDFLDGGDTIEDFLDNYPGVSREQVFAFLEEASQDSSRRSRETGSVRRELAAVASTETSRVRVRTVQEEGWGSFRNGDLLRRAEGSFDVLLTADRRMQ